MSPCRSQESHPGNHMCLVITVFQCSLSKLPLEHTSESQVAWILSHLYEICNFGQVIIGVWLPTELPSEWYKVYYTILLGARQNIIAWIKLRCHTQRQCKLSDLGRWAQWLGPQSTLAEDPSGVPRTHIGWFTSASISSSRGCGTSSLLGHLHSCTHTKTHRHTSF